jgi:hypothetical protein
MKKLFVIVMLFLLGACVLKPEKVVDMAVDFDGTGDGITYTIPTYRSNLHTVSAWIMFDNITAGYSIYATNSITLDTTATGKFQLVGFFSTQPGVWQTNETYGTGILYHVVATFDDTSTTNDPIIYVNGISKAITETVLPIGAPTIASGTTLYISAPANSFNGKIFDLKVYNRILTPAEVLDLYNSRCKVINDNGLVFHATLDGAAGITKFDGATLGASNTFTDRIGVAVGVPSGNPVGFGDNVLSICSP